MMHAIAHDQTHYQTHSAPMKRLCEMYPGSLVADDTILAFADMRPDDACPDCVQYLLDHFSPTQLSLF